MAGNPKSNWERLTNRLKPLYLKLLLTEMASPSDAINATAFVHSYRSRNICTLDENNIKEFIEATQKITIEDIKENDLLFGESHYLISDDTHFCVDRRGLNLEHYFDKQIDLITLGKLSVWDAIRFSGVLSKVEDLILKEIQSFAIDQGIDTSKADYISQRNSIRTTLFSYGVDNYLKPKVEALLNEEDESLEQVTEAVQLFSVCEAELKAGRVPEKHVDDVMTLIDATVNSLKSKPTNLDGSMFDSERYCDILNILPLEHNALRIIVGAGLVFLGLAMAAAAIALAVTSFGVSTPVSALGIAVGIDLVLAGLSIACATVSLFMAGSAGFFAASKTKSVIADAAQAYADSWKSKEGDLGILLKKEEQVTANSTEAKYGLATRITV